MNVLIVVDMQNDFITGSLGTKEAVAVVPRVIKKINGFNGRILFTRDTHEKDYLSTQEGRLLPVIHCISGTDGHRLHPDIDILRKETPIDKPTFGSVALGHLLKDFNDHDAPIDSITLVGLCTDICVISNALLIKAFLPEVSIIVDASCCAGVSPQRHRQALEAIKCCQIEVINE